MKPPVRQLIINAEDYLCHRHIKKILKTLVDPNTQDFNYEKFSAKDLTGARLVDALQTPPMMGDYRTVMVQDFESFKKVDLEALLSFVQDPSPQTHVLLVAQKIDKRTSFFKNFKKMGEVIEFKALYDNQVPEFVQSEAKSMGLTLEPGCAQDMAEMLGSHLMSIVSELEKLKLYAYPQNKISREQVAALVMTGLVSNVFQLSNDLGQRRYHHALVLFRRMIEQGEPVMRLVSMVINHFRKLLLVKSAGRLGSKELASLLGVHPFFVKDYQQQAAQFSLVQLNLVFTRLMNLSIAMRSAGLSAEGLFEGFLQETCLKAA